MCASLLAVASASGPEFSGCALVRMTTAAFEVWSSALVPPNPRLTVNVFELTEETRMYSLSTTITSPSANRLPSLTIMLVAPLVTVPPLSAVVERVFGLSSIHL